MERLDKTNLQNELVLVAEQEHSLELQSIPELECANAENFSLEDKEREPVILYASLAQVTVKAENIKIETEIR